MTRVQVTLSACEGKIGMLQAFTIFPDTATVYSAEFADSLPGAVGLARFLAMLRILTGLPADVTVTAEIEHEAVRKVVAGGHPAVRYDGECRKELHGEAAADGRKNL